MNMCYRSLYIGTGDYHPAAAGNASFYSVQYNCFLIAGADMDVCLTNYGHCNYVSGKHACIFYDEVCNFKHLTCFTQKGGMIYNYICSFLLQNAKQYELLNYSEHGTTVDNVLYSCDFSEKTSQSPSNNLLAKVQNIIRELFLFRKFFKNEKLHLLHLRSVSVLTQVCL